MNGYLHPITLLMFVAIILLMFFLGNAAAWTDFASVKPVQSFRVKAPDGVNISVQEWGNPDGPEILFIHGFLQSHLSWFIQVTDPALSEKFRMITFDLPGHGGSDKPCVPAVFNDGAHYAGMLNAVIAASGLKKPVLVGWSYGTRIVCDYLMGYGDAHIGGINFVGPAVNSDPKFVGPGTGFSGGVLSEDLAQSLNATREFNRSCFHMPPPEADLDRITAISMMVPINIRQWMKRPAPYEEVLKAIKVPVLVTHGVEDRIVRVAMAEYVVNTVHHAKASLYETVGHTVFLEAPSRFNSELAAFVLKAT